MKVIATSISLFCTYTVVNIETLKALKEKKTPSGDCVCGSGEINVFSLKFFKMNLFHNFVMFIF